MPRLSLEPVTKFDANISEVRRCGLRQRHGTVEKAQRLKAIRCRVRMNAQLENLLQRELRTKEI